MLALWQLQWEKVALHTGKLQPLVAVGSDGVLQHCSPGLLASPKSIESPIYILMQGERLSSLPVLASLLSAVQSCAAQPPDSVWILTLAAYRPSHSERIQPNRGGALGLSRSARTEAAMLGIRCADVGAKGQASTLARAKVLQGHAESEE